MKTKYDNTVEIVSSALIMNKKDGKILLIKSHKWGDLYLLPGGHIEPKEALKLPNLGAKKTIQNYLAGVVVDITSEGRG